MFVINEDNSIYVTRGDVVFFSVTAEEDGKNHKFSPGDVVRIKVYGKKDAENVVLQKDFAVTEYTEEVAVYLSEEDTKFGEVISKPTDYWYEVELNPGDNPQTIIGYDEDGAKIFKLFPEGDDIPPYQPDPEDIPVVDAELDPTSDRPVQNGVIARELLEIKMGYDAVYDAVAKLHVTPQMFGAVGDGKTDDTKAFADAVELCANNNVLLRVPSGEYVISETIEIPAYMRVAGDIGSGVIISKTTEGAAFKVGMYAEIANLCIDGNGVANGIELNGGRAFVHDVTIRKCADGILNNDQNSNLSRVSRVTILDCNRAIYLDNVNDTNSQSLSFYDVDIRGCLYGLVTCQPGSKYVNFCVQNGLSGGCAIVLNKGADNNEFMGTYLENANCAYEVDFTTAQYNRFTGGRPVQYGNAFVNNDGTNIVLTRSIQYNAAMFERGSIVHESVGVIAKETEAGLPSAFVRATNNGDNKVVIETMGTSAPTEISFNNVVYREDNLIHVTGSRKHKGFGMLSYAPTYDSFAVGEMASGFTSAIGNADLVFIQCTTPGVHAWIQKATNGQHQISAKNESGNDLSGVQVTFVIIFAETV